MKLAAHLPTRSGLAMAALTLTMHGALVAMWQHLPRVSAAAGGAPAIQVRLVVAPQPGDTAAISAAAISTAAISAEAISSMPVQGAQVALTSAGEQVSVAFERGGQASLASAQNADAAPALERLAVAMPSPSPLQTVVLTSGQAPASAPEPRLQRASNEWAYLPASELDVRPALQSAITLPFPEGENLPRGTSVGAVLVLYVSADGAVDRIEFAQSALPPAFARTAVESFAHVRMRPGMKDGRPRRAMMKIEVEFEAPLASRLAPNVASNVASNAVLESSRSWQDKE